jgi:hypothetical protein
MLLFSLSFQQRSAGRSPCNDVCMLSLNRFSSPHLGCRMCINFGIRGYAAHVGRSRPAATKVTWGCPALPRCLRVAQHFQDHATSISNSPIFFSFAARRHNNGAVTHRVLTELHSTAPRQQWCCWGLCRSTGVHHGTNLTATASGCALLARAPMHGGVQHPREDGIIIFATIAQPAVDVSAVWSSDYSWLLHTLLRC